MVIIIFINKTTKLTMCTNQKLVSEPYKFFSLRICFRKCMCIEYAPKYTLYAIWDIDVDISL